MKEDNMNTTPLPIIIHIIHPMSEQILADIKQIMEENK